MWRRGLAFDVALAESARTPTEGARSGRLTNSPASANVTLVIPRVADPLVGPPRGGHIPRDPPVRIPPSDLSYSNIALSPLTLHASRFKSSCGGEGGIRTHGPIAGTHAFQACRFDHSRTSPYRFSRGGILTCGLVTGKVTSHAHRHNIDPPWSLSYTAKKLTRIIHEGSSRNRIEAGRGASGTRRKEGHSFRSPLTAGPSPLAQTSAVAVGTFMNKAG